MKKARRLRCVVLAFAGLVSAAATAVEYELAVATGTPVGGAIPGEEFTYLGPPRLDGGDILFLADTSAGRGGMWLKQAGVFRHIIDVWAPVPGGRPDEQWGIFVDFELEAGRVVVDAEIYAPATQFANRGIWTWDAVGGLRRIADKYVEPPGVPGGRFEDVESPTFDGLGGVVFLGTPTGQTRGSLYRWEDETTTRLAAPGEVVPGVGPIFWFHHPPRARSGQVVTGVGFVNAPPPKIMRWSGTGLKTLWSTGDPLPGAPPGTGLLANSTYPFASEDGPLVMAIQESPGWGGIYHYDGSGWVPMVDTGALDPVSGVPYSGFQALVSRDGGWTGFQGVLIGNTSIVYPVQAVSPSGEIVELARNGGEIEGYQIFFVDVEGNWVSQGRAGFRVQGTGLDQIWIATLGDPPPNPLEIPAAGFPGLVVLAVGLGVVACSLIGRATRRG